MNEARATAERIIRNGEALSATNAEIRGLANAYLALLFGMEKIGRMTVCPDDKVNRLTLTAAIAIAEAALVMAALKSGKEQE